MLIGDLKRYGESSSRDVSNEGVCGASIVTDSMYLHWFWNRRAEYDNAAFPDVSLFLDSTDARKKERSM